MKSLTEKLSYIQGLAKGLNLDTSTTEGKLIDEIIDLLEDLTKDVSSHESDIEQICDAIDAIDEDLSDVEDIVYDDEDDCHCHCDDDDEEDWDEDDEENPLYEITCPKCGETVTVDEESLLSDGCECPKCGTKFEIAEDDGEETEDND
jgi:DNA-directed RNA polymerase subunit RPC12/RpoP